MDTREPQVNDVSLPFAALKLLAPPVRLVSAALWKVLKQRDVMQYGVVEEFVTSACETIPRLLTMRHQSRLVVGLRARFVLELCSTQHDVKVIEAHLERIRVPTAAYMRKDLKLITSIKNFHSFVYKLLRDPSYHEHFYKEVFPVEYGPAFDQELEKLLWEFLIRLDQLLPVPNLAQTAAWLSKAPPVLEECARAATQPQLLKILLQHEVCLGHLESAASLPPNMGDTILASLSLPPSGKVPSNHSTADPKPSAYQSVFTQAKDETQLVTPVFGLITDEDVPVLRSSSKKKQLSDELDNSRNATNEEPELEESLKFTLVKQRQSEDNGAKVSFLTHRGIKRKNSERRSSESEEDEEVFSPITSEKKQKKGKCNKEVLRTHMRLLGVKALHLPEDEYLRSIFVTCLCSQPRVVVKKLSAVSVSANKSGKGGKSCYKAPMHAGKKSPTKEREHRNFWSASAFSASNNKENRPVPQRVNKPPCRQRNNADMSALPEEDEHVADSEDEATKNFKERLFMKRYYKTKHDTFVPTLREFWKPGMTHRNLSAGSHCRR
ncbi:TERF1-interacting nuclear factor 2 [Pholidichthys leucotaenia]